MPAKIFGNGIGIDARQTPNGLRFRAWDGSTQKYLTYEMTEHEIERWLLKHALNATIEAFNLEIDRQMDCARVTGTGLYLEGPYTLNQSWTRDKKS
jgi:hypothetical protein